MKKKRYFFYSVFLILLVLLFFLFKLGDPKVNYSNTQKKKTEASELILNNLNEDKIQFIFIFSDKIYVKSNKQMKVIPKEYKESSWQIIDNFPTQKLHESSFLSNSLPIGTKLYTHDSNLDVIYVKTGNTFMLFEKYKTN